ncbi:sulfite reductase (NADPH) flavoprotein alpha-component [Povalibacter uvarum]|uniref:NADPH--hemoprotein reductase n=1 Tax=Povalibacter uvarum TaxID=732238 RepID=A0A841HN45_9GAMM|nr:sulfite reductase subunit alpha [Povalibacter uvarum]MBB6094173.1 sulfite reductase (NADPH) flavoprotein alpha-component [Povalibacter uvarum]
MLTAIEAIGTARLTIAACILVAYIIFTFWCLRPARRGSRPSIDGVRDARTASTSTLVAYASQTGFAEQLAGQTAKSLGTASVASLADLTADDLPTVSQALFVVSTTGEGDAPDPAARFVRDSLSRQLPLSNLRYAVLALGDREYDNFCAFGHRLDAWLRHQGATPMFDVVEVDNGDEGALRHWQHQLSVLSGKPDLADWETPRYERWRLADRKLINPGSAGDPCWLVTLTPGDNVQPQWHAGDIAEIDPRNSTWTDGAALPHREYSIASVPTDGAVELLIRQMQRPDGQPGLGSGWLIQQAAIGDDIALRIRPNTNFHAPADDRPSIFIGNGTGIAGLRSLLKARVAAGHFRNWLIFGERNEDRDRFFGNDLDLWQREARIEILDLVFSRDQPERRYVQHQLIERAPLVRAWIAAGASVYVCGSLQGMAPAVDAALHQILGADLVEQLTVEGRYRRDVY